MTEDYVGRWACRAVALMLTLFTVLLGGIRGSHRVAAASPHGSRLSVQRPAARDQPAVDLFGNEITQAVATYKLDATGSLYEEHSPQTEVPRLGSPSG